MYRIHQLKLRLGEDKELLPQRLLKKLGRNDLIIKEWRIARESVDARNKADICYVYSVDFVAVYKNDPKRLAKLTSNNKVKLELAPDTEYRLPSYVTEASPNTKERPVVVGFGPAGMFAALILAQAGLRPIVLERGQAVEERTATVEKFWASGKLNPQSNVQFGEGGAGTFSDGKLTTGIKDKRLFKLLSELVRAGAPEDILYKQKPHIGTDVLRRVVRAVREEIIRLGGEVRFNTLVEEILLADADGAKELCGLSLARLDSEGCRCGEEKLGCTSAIFAVGHSARDTFRMLRDKGIVMRQKPFSIGVRIEHPQELIDRAQYGATAAELGLPPAEYKLSHRCKDGRGVYTFCMCPGGEVIVAASQEGGVVTNGMSYRSRDGKSANSALLCDVRTSDFGSEDVLAGVEFQERYERLAYINGGGGYAAPHSSWAELRDGRAPAVENSLPPFALDAFREAMPQLGRRLKGFDSDDATVTAVEARSSSPVRFERNDEGEGSIYGEGDSVLTLHGFFPCGEGAGYAGGISSAAVDGIRTAEAVLARVYTK